MKNSIVDSLAWRYATKKFDISKKIPEGDLDDLLESLRLSASSFGLQPWKFIVITDSKLRKELRRHAWNQSQVTDASHLIVLCARTDINENYVNGHIQNISRARNIPLEDLKDYENKIMNSIKSMTKEAVMEWNKRQVYIALGFLLLAAAHKRIDACPMEGFDKNKFDEVLKLKEQNLTSVVLCPAGYRSAEDTNASLKKVRLDKKEIFAFKN